MRLSQPSRRLTPRRLRFHLLAPWLLACSPEHALEVVVFTDLSHSDGVREVTVEAATAPFQTLQQSTSLQIAAEDTLLLNGRSTLFPALPEGNYFVTVKALDGTATVMTQRDLLMVLDTPARLDVALAASCGAFQCPSSGDKASQVACLAGQCVSSSCSSQLPDACPSNCEGDADCPKSAACDVTRCVEGVCLQRGCSDG